MLWLRVVNKQDAAEAKKRALEAAVKQKLTSEQQKQLQQQIEKQLAREREKRESPEKAAARKQAEREAHEAAVKEAMKLAKETEGSQRLTVRTKHTFDEDAAISESTISGRTSGRSRHRSNTQFATSGDPVQLEGDREAIQQVRYQAFQQAVARKQRQGGGVVTQEDINRETRRILQQAGGHITTTKSDTKALTDYYNLYYSSEAQAKQMALVDAEAKRAQQAEVDKTIKEQAELGYSVAVTRTDEKGNKTIEFVPFSGSKVYEYVAPDPAHPHRVEKREVLPDVVMVEEKKPDVPDDPVAGFVNYFANIPKGFEAATYKITGQSKEVPVAPEVEGDVVGALAKAGSDVVTGKQVTLQEDSSSVGSFVQEKPLYSAGSLAASALFTVATFGAGPILRGSRAALAVARGSKAAQEAKTAGVTAAKVVNLEPTGVTAVKVTESGGIIASTPTTGKGFKFLVGQYGQRIVRKTVRGKPVKPKEADLFAIEKGTEDVGYVSAKTGKTAIITERVGPKEGLELVKDNPAIESIIDVHQSEARVLKQAGYSVKEGSTKAARKAAVESTEAPLGVKVAESKPTGASVIVFESEKLLQTAKDAAKRQQQIQRARDALAEARGKGKAFQWVSDAEPVKLTKTSRAPLEIIKIYESDRELSAVQKAAISAVTSSSSSSTEKASHAARSIGLGGGAALYSAKGGLGIGGATGAEKVARKRAAEDEIELVAASDPPAFQFADKSLSSAKVTSRVKVLPGTGSQARSDVASKLIDTVTSRTSVDIFRGSGSKESPRQAARSRSRSALRTNNLLRLSTKPVSRLATRQTTRQGTRFGRITATRTILRNKTPTGLLTFKFPGFVSTRKSKKQKRNEGFTIVEGAGAINPFIPALSILPERKTTKKKRRKLRKRKG